MLTVPDSGRENQTAMRAAQWYLCGSGGLTLVGWETDHGDRGLLAAIPKGFLPQN